MRGSALTGNEVVAVCPLDAVRARITVGVGHIPSTVSPERVVETVVGPCLTWSTGTWSEGSVKLVSSPGKSKGTGDDGASGQESSEGQHDEKLVGRLKTGLRTRSNCWLYLSVALLFVDNATPN